jgi:hypothetical protein
MTGTAAQDNLRVRYLAGEHARVEVEELLLRRLETDEGENTRLAHTHSLGWVRVRVTLNDSDHDFYPNTGEEWNTSFYK